MRTSTTGKSNNRGLTLVELLVVIALIGVILVLSVPSMRDAFTADNLKKASRQIIGLERQLRADAVRDRTDYILCLDVQEAVWWVETADMTPERVAEVKTGARRLPAKVLIADIVLEKNTKRTQGEIRLKFGKNGICPPFVVHLTEGENHMTLVVNPFLGVTAVYDRYVEISLEKGPGRDSTS
jgi:prepilin-type N-terminal cleavage/methylation domain-containing protein